MLWLSLCVCFGLLIVLGVYCFLLCACFCVFWTLYCFGCIIYIILCFVHVFVWFWTMHCFGCILFRSLCMFFFSVCVFWTLCCFRCIYHICALCMFLFGFWLCIVLDVFCFVLCACFCVCFRLCIVFWLYIVSCFKLQFCALYRDLYFWLFL